MINTINYSVQLAWSQIMFPRRLPIARYCRRLFSTTEPPKFTVKDIQMHNQYASYNLNVIYILMRVVSGLEIFECISGDKWRFMALLSE